MGSEVQTSEEAEAIAESYADEECVGTLGEITQTTHEGDRWVVEFHTHTFADEYTHRIEITDAVGNIIAHERTKV